MKRLKVIIVSLLIFIVNSDHNIERSNHIQRFASKVSGSDEELDDHKLGQEEHQKCNVFGIDSFSTSNPKIQFEIFVREPIFYMQVKEVSVIIYNEMSSKDFIDVDVSIPNDADNLKFQFFNNESDPKDEQEFTKITNVSYHDAKYVSFYTRIKDIVEINEVMNITIKARVKSENYECYITKSINIKLPGIKVYHNSENTFNLVSTRQPVLMPITPYNPNNLTKIEDLRTSVKITGHRNKFNKIDFSVTLPNEYDSDEEVHVTTENDPIEVNFPKYKKNAMASIKGTGSCTIKVITEFTMPIKKLNPKFNLNMTRLPSPKDDEPIVRICATYNPKLNDLKTLSNVIYYVEMQCGFVLEEAIDKSQKAAIKRIEPRWNSSQVQIFFNDFEGNKNYCVDIRTKNKHNCYYVGDSVIMVYDNSNKENLAVGYYNFDYRFD